MTKVNQSLQIDLEGYVVIREKKTNKIIFQGNNHIHGQNAARAISRLFANEPNGAIYRIAFGNGASTTTATGNIILRKPNDGTAGEGWESRLYNETFSKVIDEDAINFGQNPNGGANPTPTDLANSGVFSQEVGTKSNVTVTVFLNENEPSGQLQNTSISNPLGEERQFIFDEIALYTAGKPPVATNGKSSVNVGDKISTDEFPIEPNHVSTLNIIVDGVTYASQITVPASGTGPGGIITFGDFCEGINSGAWVTGGDALNSVLYVFITDRSIQQYPSIIAKESFGFLTFQSKTTGQNSSVELLCNDQIADNFFNVLTGGICGNTNVNQLNGENAGVQNDPANPTNERERLLAHIIFQPQFKAQNIALKITYTITITVKPGQNSVVSQAFVS